MGLWQQIKCGVAAIENTAKKTETKKLNQKPKNQMNKKPKLEM